MNKIELENTCLWISAKKKQTANFMPEYALTILPLRTYSNRKSIFLSVFKKEKGFYIECCDTDGEKDSTSLFFERVRKWNGLVMTADPKKFSKLLQKNRRALTMNACLSQSFRVEKVRVTI